MFIFPSLSFNINFIFFFFFFSIAHTLNRNLSPFAQRKHIQSQDAGFWNLQHPPDGGGGGVNNTLIGSGSNSASPSPLMGRKRFQTTIPVSDSQYVRPQGNTSPIGNIYIVLSIQ